MGGDGMRRWRIVLGVLVGAVLVAAAACGGGGGGDGPERPADPAEPDQAAMLLQAAPVVVVSDDVRSAVTDRFQAFFNAYATALLALDPAALDGVAADGAREAVAAEIGSLQGEGHALMLLSMAHRPLIMEAAGGRVVVEGTAEYEAVPVRPGTQDPAGDPVRDAYTYRLAFEERDGTWVAVALEKGPAPAAAVR